MHRITAIRTGTAWFTLIVLVHLAFTSNPFA